MLILQEGITAENNSPKEFQRQEKRMRGRIKKKANEEREGFMNIRGQLPRELK